MAEKGTTELPTDAKAHPIQVLAPDATVTINTTASSQNIAIPAGIVVAMLSATQATWVEFGPSSGVTAVIGGSPSFLLPAGGVSIRIPDGSTHMAAIQNDTGGRVCLTKLV